LLAFLRREKKLEIMIKYISFFLLSLSWILTYCKTQEVQEKSNKDLSSLRKEEQAYLGILYVETSSGVQIAEVFPDSPAQKSGLEAGDLILSANGYPVLGPYTLKENIFSLKPGTEVILEVEKLNGKRVIIKATLEPMPEKYKKFYHK
jgi:S1-C subfamily serine protease